MINYLRKISIDQYVNTTWLCSFTEGLWCPSGPKPLKYSEYMAK